MSSQRPTKEETLRLVRVAAAVLGPLILVLIMVDLVHVLPLFGTILILGLCGISVFWAGAEFDWFADFTNLRSTKSGLALVNVLQLFWLWAMATGIICVLTFALSAHGKVEFGQKPDSVIEVTQFYDWHIADLIPLADVPQTLRWREPLHGYSDHTIGFLVLLLQVAFVIPFIAALRRLWKAAEAESAQADEASSS